MINFPVLNGTSGHLLSGVLAAVLLGVLTMALIVSVQALLFSDGGITALSANVLDVALIGTGVCGLLWQFVSVRVNRSLALACMAWFSTVAASVACSIELGLSETINFSKVLPAMFSVHALIGVGEACISWGLLELIFGFRFRTSPRLAGVIMLGAALTTVMLSPFASACRDGLESVAHQYFFLKQAEPLLAAPLANYIFPGINHDAMTGVVAGLLGVLLITILAGGGVGLASRLKMACIGNEVCR